MAVIILLHISVFFIKGKLELSNKKQNPIAVKLIHIKEKAKPPQKKHHNAVVKNKKTITKKSNTNKMSSKSIEAIESIMNNNLHKELDELTQLDEKIKRDIAQEEEREKVKNTAQAIQSQIKEVWHIPNTILENAFCEIELELDSYGYIISLKIINSNKSEVFNQFAIQAVEQAAPFMQAKDLPKQMRKIILNMRPDI